MMNQSGEKESFFNVFSFTSLMHDAADHCLIYFDIRVTKSIEVGGTLRLEEGQEYEQVIFDFNRGLFSFENYHAAPEKEGDVGYKENMILRREESSVDILQADLVPFLKW